MVSVNWNILAVSVRTIDVTGGSSGDNRMATKIRVPKWLDVVINLIDFTICCNLNESPVLSRQGITAVPICYNNHFHLMFHPGETPVPPRWKLQFHRGGTASLPEWNTKRRHIKIQSFQPSAPSFNAH